MTGEVGALHHERDSKASDRQKIFEGKRAARSVFHELTRRGKSTDDWMKLVTMVCYDDEAAHEMLWKMTMDGPPTTEEEEKLLRYHLMLQFNKKLNNMDNLTKVGAMGYMEQLYEPWEWFGPSFYCAPFIHADGVIAGISGNLGAGKTNLVCILIDHLLQLGFKVITNVWIGSEDVLLEGLPEDLEPRRENYHYVKLFSDLLMALASPGRAVIILDEISQFLERKRPNAEVNIAFEHFIRLMRKMEASLIAIEQHQDRFITFLEDLMSTIYIKPSKKTMDYQTSMEQVRIHKYIENVPRTRLPWSTWHPASFRSDINLEELNDYLVRTDTFKKADLLDILPTIMKDGTVGADGSEEEEGGSPEETTERRTVEMLLSKRHRWAQVLNSRSSFDWKLLRYHYRLSEGEAKTVAQVLNKETTLEDRKTFLTEAPVKKKRVRKVRRARVTREGSSSPRT